MKITAAELAELLQGDIVGNPKVEVKKLAKIEEGVPESICFLSNKNYTDYIYSSKASIAIVNKSFVPTKEIPSTLTLVKVNDSRIAFSKVLEAYHKMTHAHVGIHKTAIIDETAIIGKEVYISAGTYIGKNAIIKDGAQIYPNCSIGQNVSIGEKSILKPGVVVMEACIIGSECVLHPGVIIGGDGFGFAPNAENSYQKIIHTGNVVIEDHVEIGANTTIDKATLGSTIIRKGVKLDNLIQVGHNVEIGENTVIASQTGIAGSTRIGKNCMIGGQVGIIGHITIADGVKIAAQSGIGQSITKEGEIVQGSPAFSIGDYKRSYVMFRKLPEFSRQVNEIIRKFKNQ